MLDDIDFWSSSTEEAYHRFAETLVEKGVDREEAEGLLYEVYQATREEYE